MPTKQTRKILKVGGSHAVTLPKEWKDFHDFKDDMESEGKEVEMLADHVIILYMKGDKKGEERAEKMMEKFG